MAKPFAMNYQKNPGERGSPRAWKNAFNTRLGIEAARAEVGADSPEGILGVPRGSAWPVIKAAYWKLAKLHHPDMGGDPVKFRRIQGAYEVLEARHG